MTCGVLCTGWTDILAATCNTKEIAKELLSLDSPLDTHDEDVKSRIIAREIAHVTFSLTHGLLEKQPSHHVGSAGGLSMEVSIHLFEQVV